MLCREQLVELRISYDRIKDLNAERVAVSTNKPVEFSGTIERLGITYPVLYDLTTDVPQLYGVYGEDAAVPSIFIIDKSGIIRWKFVAGDDHDLPSMKLIIRQLEALQKG